MSVNNITPEYIAEIMNSASINQTKFASECNVSLQRMREIACGSVKLSDNIRDKVYIVVDNYADLFGKVKSIKGRAFLVNVERD